ncbi:WbqC family protein [Desulfatitalea tepidiphila]|uniref:WbqC family protein n=1 Tax=Desulfatitalea tepidiphila TaxID=1185843 RepID=UPI0006B6117C|nr:WbqC family protein [Desulfatitalea tepidiphila]
MIVTISQPRYLPWLGYFHRIAASDLFIYLDTVQYTPRDWENRNKVKTSQGAAWLTVPVKARYRCHIPQVIISDTQSWQKKHWHTIVSCYSRAPYFQRYEGKLKEIYQDRTWAELTDLNVTLTKVLCQCLGLSGKRFMKASELGVPGRGNELLLNLCKAVGATVYLSGSQGCHYMDERAFGDAGIGVRYQNYLHPLYPQQFGDFLPCMAVVDLLFNCGDQSLEILMQHQQDIK